MIEVPEILQDSCHDPFPRRALEIYRRHRDKDWQMTDCLSFAAMRQQHLREALTGDHHFEQAGFQILFH